MAYLITELLKLQLEILMYGFLALLPIIIIAVIVKRKEMKKQEEREQLRDEAARTYIEQSRNRQVFNDRFDPKSTKQK